MSDEVLIIGACVRPAAFSARRAGFSPIACDLFGDLDLRACCPSEVVRRYPGGFVTFARRAAPLPWIYTGGLENYPRVVDRISQWHPLYGNRGATLHQVRDPRRVGEVLSSAGLNCPSWSENGDEVPRDATWVRKTIRSAGGGGVVRWSDSSATAVAERRCFFQRYVGGTPCGAIYVAAGGDARLIGVSEQLIGTDWTAAQGFRYSGSLGPMPLSDAQRRQLERIGGTLAAAFDLIGLFGVDVVLDGEEVWAIEVNPRYASSIEVLERALDIPTFAWHVETCRTGSLPRLEQGQARHWSGKAILYARRDVVIDAELTGQFLGANQGLERPRFADIPAEGTRVRAGLPIVTLLDDAADRATLEAGLRGRVAGLERLLYAT